MHAPRGKCNVPGRGGRSHAPPPARGPPGRSAGSPPARSHRSPGQVASGLRGRANGMGRVHGRGRANGRQAGCMLSGVHAVAACRLMYAACLVCEVEVLVLQLGPPVVGRGHGLEPGTLEGAQHLQAGVASTVPAATAAAGWVLGWCVGRSLHHRAPPCITPVFPLAMLRLGPSRHMPRKQGAGAHGPCSGQTAMPATTSDQQCPSHKEIDAIAHALLSFSASVPHPNDPTWFSPRHTHSCITSRSTASCCRLDIDSVDLLRTWHIAGEHNCRSRASLNASAVSHGTVRSTICRQEGSSTRGEGIARYMSLVYKQLKRRW